MSPGVCLDALHPMGAPSASALRAAGADGGRLVAFHDDRFYGYHAGLKAANLRTALVLARESFDVLNPVGYQHQAREYAKRCQPDYWVLGNEPDGYLLPGSDPSWAMTPDRYANFWEAAATGILYEQPDAKLLLAGLVSGQSWWGINLWQLLTPAPYGFDCHPYGKDPEEARALVLAYGLPHPFVLEWNRPVDQIAEYGAMLAEETEWSTYFAWHDVDGLGLHDAAGNPKPELAEFTKLGGTTMRLEDAEKRSDWSLGPRWKQNGTPMPIETVKPGERVGFYTDGYAIEKNGEVWPLVAANKESLIPVLERYGFRVVPA